MTKFVKYNFKGKVAPDYRSCHQAWVWATAKSFADAGASVVLADYREDAVAGSGKRIN